MTGRYFDPSYYNFYHLDLDLVIISRWIKTILKDQESCIDGGKTAKYFKLKGRRCPGRRSDVCMFVYTCLLV